MATDSYDQYVRTEWSLFVNDPARAERVKEIFENLKVERVLDVGCGAGQELLPFALSAFCVGTDVAAGVGVVGRELFSDYEGARVVFIRAGAESLPFMSESFDVVICRLALPYTDNSRSLAEIARVLRPGGALMLKIHHMRYYLTKLRAGLFSADIPSMIHAARVLLAGTIYHATGKQIRWKIISNETFQTRWLLQRELRRVGLSVQRELDQSELTPFFLITRNA